MKEQQQKKLWKNLDGMKNKNKKKGDVQLGELCEHVNS